VKRICSVPEFIDPVFAKTSRKRSFSVIENERFRLVFAKTGSINSGTERVLNFSPVMGARNQGGIGLSYRHASLRSLTSQFQTRFLESIPRPIAGLKFSTLSS
jgi:hypothetical protein